MTDPDSPDLPEDLRALDRTLAQIRFQPRDGFAAEVVGSAGRARPHAVRAAALRRRIPLMAASLAALALAGWAGWTRTVVTVDRCCFDLDGGAEHDDGLLVLARRNEEVRRLAIYEDRDNSRTFSAADVLRFSRGPAPTVLDPATDLVTTHHCCVDFDGGGPHDDGLLVVGVPPDRVLMAALYEESPDRSQTGRLLR